MTDDRSPTRSARLTVEFVAEEARVTVAEVTLLCDREVAQLGVGARVNDFLPILALRKVRSTLRQRATTGGPAR